jgi:tRNA pseudouridine55 synthase
MTGVLNLDKPQRFSSAYAVRLIKRMLPRGYKVGHAGTLDPFATGVLLVLIGKATRCSEALMSEPKQYDTTVRFGFTTPTDDPTVVATPFVPRSGGKLKVPSSQAVREAVARFVGSISQIPPSFSALKVAGRSAYQIARKGLPVTLKPRTVIVHGIEILGYEWPTVRLRIDCGRGTYIRSIARDLGELLDVGGHLSELRRTTVGPFRIGNALNPASLNPDNLASHLTQYGPPLTLSISVSDGRLDHERDEDQEQK